VRGADRKQRIIVRPEGEDLAVAVELDLALQHEDSFFEGVDVRIDRPAGLKLGYKEPHMDRAFVAVDQVGPAKAGSVAAIGSWNSEEAVLDVAEDVRHDGPFLFSWPVEG
jgi:hypothetical protein